ncbi:hypothetical protein SSS_09593 [Sarcoptes scabiei]|nr:hypothetical protein SSS_09593 [Sarcoptes scabiei]
MEFSLLHLFFIFFFTESLSLSLSLSLSFRFVSICSPLNRMFSGLTKYQFSRFSPFSLGPCVFISFIGGVLLLFDFWSSLYVCLFVCLVFVLVIFFFFLNSI